MVTEYGVLRTIDGGRTWCGIKVTGLADSIYQLLIDPHDSKVLCLATECGVYRSPDGGRKWERIYLSR
jgi:photosystem II stability/assembly factor-like uncharacterized protein